MKKLYLWSRRYSTAKGNHWVLEREVTQENHAQWREVFEKDEPGVLFLVSSRRPAK